MLVYRFKVISEEYEDFSREICIQPAQTFLEFHSCLMETAELLPCEQASFFLTDKKYKKNREIGLNPVERQVKRYDEEMDEMVMVKVTPRLMKESKVKDFIEDPHQRLVYEYHGKEYFIFLLELVKIMQSDGVGIYPKCVKRIGEIPKKKETFIVSSREEKTKQSDLDEAILPGLDALSRLDGIEENDDELAEIEENLSDILFGDKKGDDQNQNEKEPEGKEEISTEANPEPSEDAGKEDLINGMERLDDYENIEDIEIKYAKFGNDSNDE